jgi:hypothetical protein
MFLHLASRREGFSFGSPGQPATREELGNSRAESSPIPIGSTRPTYTAPKPPLRAITIKADALRAAMRNGNQLDYSDIHERFNDLWQEARMAIWAKHSRAWAQTVERRRKCHVMTFVSDEAMVLKAIDTTKGVLDSLVKPRREMGPQTNRIPRWAIERIERVLCNPPAALKALLKELAAEEVEWIRLKRLTWLLPPTTNSGITRLH